MYAVIQSVGKVGRRVQNIISCTGINIYPNHDPIPHTHLLGTTLAHEVKEALLGKILGLRTTANDIVPLLAVLGLLGAQSSLRRKRSCSGLGILGRDKDGIEQLDDCQVSMFTKSV